MSSKANFIRIQDSGLHLFGVFLDFACSGMDLNFPNIEPQFINYSKSSTHSRNSYNIETDSH